MTRRTPARRLAGAPDDRGLSPVVGKTLELGVGVLLVALLTTVFFGTVVPDYRTAVGEEVGDRSLAAAADRIETAVPSIDPVAVDRRVAVRLPDAIRGSPYRIVAREGPPPSIRLVHPDDAVGGRLRLTLPGAVEFAGSWRSTSPSHVVVAGDSPTSVRLVDGPRNPDGDSEPPRTATEGST